MPKVYFVAENVIVNATKGQTIREVALKHGVYLNREYIYHLNCGGRGLCGTCRVWVKDRNEPALTPRTTMEKAYGMRGMQRLACQAKILADVAVYTVGGGEDRLDPQRPIDPPVVDWDRGSVTVQESESSSTSSA